MPETVTIRSRLNAKSFALAAMAILLASAVICRMDARFFPLAFFAPVGAGFVHAIMTKGIRPAAACSLRCLLTGLASLIATGVATIVLFAAIALLMLVTSYRFNVERWSKDIIPGCAPREEPSNPPATLSLGLCVIVGGAIGTPLALGGWYISSRRWATLGVIGCPFVLLAEYWPDIYQFSPRPTPVPLFGTFDGGSIMICLAATLFAAGAWLGDRRRELRMSRHEGLTN